jgi:serine/threonine-protein kinase
MGHVYECVHVQLHKRVAIKVLREHLLDDQVIVQRFLREGRAVCHIDHLHVVAVYELGSDAEAPYLVMELLEGMHLGDKLRSHGPLPLPELVEIMLPVLSAVSAAHAAGIVHRDLKPSNIMLARARDGTIVPKVLDFGTSKLDVEDGEQLLTITGALLGTIHYMSPEQTRAPRDVDAKSDQYSLGLMLYECATGRKPFSADSSYELMHAIMTAPVAAPSALNPSLPKAFDQIVQRAMSRLPRERYPSVRALGAALIPFASAGVAQQWSAEFLERPSVDELGARGAIPDESGDALIPSGRRSSNPTASTLIDRVSRPIVLRLRRRTGVLLLVGLLAALAVAVAVTLRAYVAPQGDSPGSATPSATDAASTSEVPRRQREQRREALPESPSAVPHVATTDVPAAAAAAPAVAPVPAPAVNAESRAPSASAPATKPVPRRTRAKPAAAARPVPLGENGAPILE